MSNGQDSILGNDTSISATPSLDHRILVVDDAVTNRFLLRHILQQEGFVIDEAADGEECLEYCAKRLPSLILLDVMMPGLDGFEVCRRLRQKHTDEQLPIMMVTTLGESEHLSTGFSAGASDFISKPIDRSVLLARMQRHLSRGSMVRELRRASDELARSLRMQQAMGDAFPDGVAVHIVGGPLVYSNARLTELCHGTEPNSMEDVAALIGEGQLSKETRGRLEEIANDLEAELHEELSFGVLRPYHFQCVSLPVGEHVSLPLRLWMFRDMTRIRKLERRVNQRLKLDSVGKFAAGVAHNFNNLLGVVQGAVDVLGRYMKDDARAQRCLQNLTASVQNSAEFTRRMYAVVQPDARAAAPSSNLVEILDEVTRQVCTPNGDRIETVIKADDALPRVKMASEHVREILTSILKNAVEAIDQAGLVSISVQRDAAGDKLEVIVADTGKGMKGDILEKIFEPFYSTKRLDEQHGVSFAGHGLGMWNTYYLLRTAGGDIEVFSQPEFGTQVHLHFPIAATVP